MTFFQFQLLINCIFEIKNLQRLCMSYLPMNKYIGCLSPLEFVKLSKCLLVILFLVVVVIALSVLLRFKTSQYPFYTLIA
jgi:hypothetical protein